MVAALRIAALAALALPALAVRPVPALAAGIGAPVLHQQPAPRESGVDNVRRRQAESGQGDRTEPYWVHFELKNTGHCDEAVPGLRDLANNGRGYEYAQHALGLCLLDVGRHDEALMWIGRAAEAGLPDAQATYVRLFAQDKAPFTDPATGAQWLYLYQNNPMRLAMGAANPLEPDVIAAARSRMPRDAYLRGIGRARVWTPTYWKAAGTADARPARME